MVNERFSLDALLDDRSRHSSHDEWKTMLTAVVIAAATIALMPSHVEAFVEKREGWEVDQLAIAMCRRGVSTTAGTAHVVKPFRRPCPSSLWWFWCTICVFE